MAQKQKNKLAAVQPARKKTDYQILMMCAVLVLLTGLTFWPSVSNSFTNWDDPDYVYQNPDITGISAHNIAKVFSKQYVANYQPITMMSYMLDYTLFGPNFEGYHGVSLLFHILNCLLLFVLLQRLTRIKFIAFVAALLFAIHPLRVESVAWIAERKDLLFTLFYFSALHYYLSYIRSGKWLYMLYATLLTMLSMLSKPMAVSLPLVMLLVDYYLKRQWSKRLLLEKLPVFFVAGICAIITFLIQKHAGAVTDLPALSHVQRLCVPFYCLLFYIVKTLIPLHLSALYFLPHHIGKTTSLMLYGSPFVVAAGAGLLWYFRAYGRTMVFGLAFMIITLVPVLQIVPVGAALVADRYTYIAFVGIYLLAGTFLYKLIFETLKRKPDMRTMVYVLLAVVCTTLCVLTYKRCEVWKDSFTLWNDVIGKYPSAIAYNNLGTAYSDLENNDKTIYYATKALELDSTYVLAYNNRGSAYSRTGIQNMAMYNKDYGTFKCAIDDFSRALTLKPDYAQAYANRGNVYSAQKLYERAFADYARSIQFQPKNSEVYYNRGLLYNELGQFDNAIINFNKAIVISPGAAHVYNDRGVAYAQKGNLGQAIADFRTSLSLRPSAPDVEGNLNRALEMLNSVPAPTDAMHEK